MAVTRPFVVTARDTQELFDALENLPSGQRIVKHDYEFYREDGKEFIEIILHFEAD